jgi:hypothetical protein
VRVPSVPRASLRVSWQDGQERRTSPANQVLAIKR